jgi:diadenosine tetraphosphate (Ap4A) HIT family hydrolase
MADRNEDFPQMTAFQLDPTLAADTVPVTKLALSELRLMNNAAFPWLLLVPQRADIAEIIDLDQRDQAVLFDEITLVSRALKAATDCHKLNVAALGNMVRQLHVHVIARFTSDAAWPRPVWGTQTVAYGEEARDRLIATIRSHLPA